MFVSAHFDDVRSALDQDAYALALSLYAVVAVLVLVMAVAGLAVSTAVQMPARRRDAASPRAVGVSRRAVMSSVAWEFLTVLGGATVAGIGAGLLAQYVVLRTVTLGYADDGTTPRVIADLDWQQIAVLAVLAAVALGAAAVTSAGLTVQGARGSTLREDAR
jgi:predicted lysophospholipase L1 biosynthesis ABC-type transport system permease subunit